MNTKTKKWIKAALTRSVKTVVANYDFEANPDNIFAVPLSELDENQLCGGNNEPEHEVM